MPLLFFPIDFRWTFFRRCGLNLSDRYKLAFNSFSLLWGRINILFRLFRLLWTFLLFLWFYWLGKLFIVDNWSTIFLLLLCKVLHQLTHIELRLLDGQFILLWRLNLLSL